MNRLQAIPRTVTAMLASRPSAPGPEAPRPCTEAPDVPAGPATEDARAALVSWTIAAILVAFLCVTHAGVLACFALGATVPNWLAPAALLGAVGVGALLARHEGLPLRGRIGAAAGGIGVVGLAVVLAAWFFDFGWDGQWYHQNAVLQMARGWNPVRDPLKPLPDDVATWLHHYSKGPWYVALALYETTQQIEWAKAATWVALGASFFAALAASLEFTRNRAAALGIAAVFALNPVVVCELPTYLVDGLLGSHLACFVAAVAGGFRRPGWLARLVAIGAAILCINTKQTGLVYVCFVIAAAGLYTLFSRRDQLRCLAATHASALLLGTGLLGFNPYVTNALHRGNPFYPWLGSAAYPGFDRPGNDPTDRYDMPRNLAGRNRVYRVAYSVFGRPGNQPLSTPNAELMAPLDFRWQDLLAYRAHGLRVAGFGPLFSAAMLLSIGLLAASIRPGVPWRVVWLGAGTIIASVLVGMHGWWARYVPQLWLLPVTAVVAGLALPVRRWARWTAIALGALLLLNTALVGFVHFHWEIEASRTLRRQLALLRAQPSVKVDLRYFGVAYGERLRRAGVRFQEKRPLDCPDPIELMSVAPGYPGAVRACILPTHDPAAPP